jgi:hypothetical protein
MKTKNVKTAGAAKNTKRAISALTAEQEALLPVYAEKWLRIGLATGPAERDRCEEHIRAAYVAAELTPPEKFVFLRSPLEGVKRVADDIGLTPAVALEHMCYGSQDASWLAFYDYMLTVLGITDCERLLPLINLATVCGWWSPYENVCYVQDRPAEIHMEDGKLHNPHGPAVLYSDGFGVYAWRGVRVNAETHALAARVAAADSSLESMVSVESDTRVVVNYKDKTVPIDGAVVDVMNKFGDLDGVKRAILLSP